MSSEQKGELAAAYSEVMAEAGKLQGEIQRLQAQLVQVGAGCSSVVCLAMRCKCCNCGPDCSAHVRCTCQASAAASSDMSGLKYIASCSAYVSVMTSCCKS